MFEDIRIENLSQDLQKIFVLKTSKEVSFQGLSNRIDELERECQKLIYHGMLRFWNVVTDLVSLIVFDGLFIKNTIQRFFQRDGITSFIDFASKYNVPQKYLDFIIDYTAYNRFLFLTKYNEYLENPCYEKYEELVDTGIEIANIRFWEVKGLNFTCHIFDEGNFTYDCIGQGKCEVENPHLRIYLFYEYFLLDEIDVFDIFLSSISRYFTNYPKNFKFVIDLKFLRKRLYEIEKNRIINPGRITKFKMDLETISQKPVEINSEECFKRLKEIWDGKE